MLKHAGVVTDAGDHSTPSPSPPSSRSYVEGEPALKSDVKMPSRQWPISDRIVATPQVARRRHARAGLPRHNGRPFLPAPRVGLDGAAGRALGMIGVGGLNQTEAAAAVGFSETGASLA